MVIEPKII